MKSIYRLCMLVRYYFIVSTTLVLPYTTKAFVSNNVLSSISTTLIKKATVLFISRRPSLQQSISSHINYKSSFLQCAFSGGDFSERSVWSGRDSYIRINRRRRSYSSLRSSSPFSYSLQTYKLKFDNAMEGTSNDDAEVATSRIQGDGGADENGYNANAPVIVNILDLAAACIACTYTASVAIQTIKTEQVKNTRLKEDGSFVTDADYIAQGVIVAAVRSISDQIRIIGEESAEEMMQHMQNPSYSKSLIELNDDNNAYMNAIKQRSNYEVRLRFHNKLVNVYPLASSTSTAKSASSENSEEGDKPLSSSHPISFSELEDLEGTVDPDECYFDVSRISVVVDPLDGTNSYSKGEYDVVSTLIAVLIDNEPYFGVIGKPFGYTGLSPMLDTSCVTVYGGPLLKGVYVAGQKDPVNATLPVLETLNEDQSNIDDLPRAVISRSRSKGVVRDFCHHLSEYGLIHPDPMLISGAGEKSLRLILHRNKEALWFFPKPGTARWDIAAPDALLRALGGKITDKYGNNYNYNTIRTESENTEGIIACINSSLHSKCIELFQQGDWINQR